MVLEEMDCSPFFGVISQKGFQFLLPLLFIVHGLPIINTTPTHCKKLLKHLFLNSALSIHGILFDCPLLSKI